MVELEMQNVFRINMLKEHKENPKLLDFIWANRYKEALRGRLEKLERDFSKGLVSDKAYVIWKQMINEVI